MVSVGALQAERRRLQEMVARGEITVEEADRRVRAFIAAREAVPTTPPEEMVEAEAESRKEFGKLPPSVVSPEPPSAVVPGGEPGPTRISLPEPLTPEEVEATGKRVVRPAVTLAQAQELAEEERRKRRVAEFFSGGGFEKLEELQEAAAKEAREAESAASKIRQLGISLFEEGEVPSSPGLEEASSRLSSFLEGVGDRPLSLGEYARYEKLWKKYAEEFGKVYGIGPRELETRLSIAKGEGLLDKLEKEQREAIEAAKKVAEFGEPFFRREGESEAEYYRRTLKLAEKVPGEAARQFAESAKVVLRGPPEPTFGGKLFKAAIDVEKKAGPVAGPALAALGQMGARIYGSFEELTGWLGEVTGMEPKGKPPRVPPPTYTSPIFGLSPLEVGVHPARRFSSALAAGAVAVPLESKAFGAGLRMAGRAVLRTTRGIGESFVYGQVTRKGLAGAGRVLDVIEGFQLKHKILSKPLELFFEKPKMFGLAEAGKVTSEITGRVSRGGVRAVEKAKFAFRETGVKITERQLRDIQNFLRTLEPRTAVVSGVKRLRGVVGKTAYSFKGLARRPGGGVLRLLSGEGPTVKMLRIGKPSGLVKGGKALFREADLSKTVSRLYRQATFGFKEPSVGTRIRKFFQPVEGVRFKRVPLGEGGAEIGRVTRHLPFRVRRFTRFFKSGELTLKGVPEISELTKVRKAFRTYGVQRPSVGEINIKSVMERLKIEAFPKKVKPTRVRGPPAGGGLPYPQELATLPKIARPEIGLFGEPIRFTPLAAYEIETVSTLPRLGAGLSLAAGAAVTILPRAKARERVAPIARKRIGDVKVQKPIERVIVKAAARGAVRGTVGEARKQRIKQRLGTTQALKVPSVLTATIPVTAYTVPTRELFLPPPEPLGGGVLVKKRRRKRSEVEKVRITPLIDITRLSPPLKKLKIPKF